MPIDVQKAREAFEEAVGGIPPSVVWNPRLEEYTWADYPSVTHPGFNERWEMWLDGSYWAVGSREELKDLLTGLVDLYYKNTCMHEDTHRGGVIWEICDQCGQSWADDQGGRPEYKEPKVITDAEELIQKLGS